MTNDLTRWRDDDGVAPALREALDSATLDEPRSTELAAVRERLRAGVGTAAVTPLVPIAARGVSRLRPALIGGAALALAAGVVLAVTSLGQRAPQAPVMTARAFDVPARGSGLPSGAGVGALPIPDGRPVGDPDALVRDGGMAINDAAAAGVTATVFTSPGGEDVQIWIDGYLQGHGIARFQAVPGQRYHVYCERSSPPKLIGIGEDTCFSETSDVHVCLLDQKRQGAGKWDKQPRSTPRTGCPKLSPAQVKARQAMQGSLDWRTRPAPTPASTMYDAMPEASSIQDAGPRASDGDRDKKRSKPSLDWHKSP